MSALAGSGSKPKNRRISAIGLMLGLVFSCGSDAVGVEACRQIETARCRAAEACGEVSDAESCERFYRDQCLHGFSVAEPSDRQVEACAVALDAVEECARSEDGPGDCACDAVIAPESLRECAFLAPEDAGDDEGEAGRGGTPADDDADDDEQGAGGTTAGQGGTPDEAEDEGDTVGGSAGADQAAGAAGAEPD